MWIVTLDVKATHANNPDCPMRLVQTPKGEWMCADCGMHILHKRMEVGERHILATPFYDGLEDKLPGASMGCRVPQEKDDYPCEHLEKTPEELETYDVPERTRRKLAAEADLFEQMSPKNQSIFGEIRTAEPDTEDGDGCCKKFTPETEQFRQEWPAKILWYPEDGTCPVCQEPYVSHGGETYSYIGRPVHPHCFGTAQMWNDNRDLVPNRFRYYKHKDGTREPRFTPEELARGPYWRGKDVVGYLIRRGWQVREDGLYKKGAGMLSEKYIPATMIVSCTMGAESAADWFEETAKETPKGCPIAHHHHTCDCNGMGGAR